MATVLDSSLKVSWFKLQLRWYVHFQTNAFEKSMNLLIPRAMGEIVSPLFFYKDAFDIK